MDNRQVGFVPIFIKICARNDHGDGVAVGRNLGVADPDHLREVVQSEPPRRGPRGLILGRRQGRDRETGGDVRVIRVIRVISRVISAPQAAILTPNQARQFVCF